jgi:transposase
VNVIRTSKHHTVFCNTAKKENLSLFVNEYRRVTGLILDDIWSNGYKGFSIQKNKLEFPKYIDYNDFQIETILTARALSSLVTQLSGTIRAATEKQRKRLFILEKMKQENVSKQKRKLLIRKIKQNIPQKPAVFALMPELSSKCSEFIPTSEKHFHGFLKLKSVFKNKTEIVIPIKHHKHSVSLQEKGKQMNSFLIGKDFVNIRWDIQTPEEKQVGKTLGIDQGMKDVLTCSDGYQTPKTDKHGHSLESILTRLSNKKKGSKSFKRTQEQRSNFINWSINQLNVSDIKEIKLEHIWNIGYKSGKSRILSHWTNTNIRDKVISVCELNGVHLTEQKSTYRSQRCSGCGMVRKANRKGKVYQCKSCGLVMDADVNASINISLNLPEIPYTLRQRQLNRAGFIWNEAGLFDLSGRSLESLPPVKDSHV